VIKFDKPTNLNGSQLLDELAAVGIILDKINEAPFIDGDGNFYLQIKPEDEANAAAVVAAHNGTTVAPEPTVEDKLASVGLNLEDLRAETWL
jgi:hypothetical protein